MTEKGGSKDGSKDANESQLVEWYGADDPDNPQNWSTAKKSFVMFEICLLTFAGM